MIDLFSLNLVELHRYYMATIFNIVTSTILILLTIACIIMVTLISQQQKAVNTTSEMFQNNPNNVNALAQLALYGVGSLEEAKQIVNGTWDEPWAAIPKNAAFILYYSVFSSACRSALKDAPYVWSNLSPNFEAKLPENCKVDDSKIAFASKPFSDQSVLGMYVKGITANNNLGNGPLAMNMGLNVSSTEPQKFSLAFLLRFNNLSLFNGQTISTRIDVLDMKANTPNNNGIKIRLDIGTKTQNDYYRVSVRVSVADQPDLVIGGFEVKAQMINYYMISIVRDGNVVTVAMHSIDIHMLSDKPQLMGTASLAYVPNIDFSNRALTLSTTGVNITNILAFAVVQTSIDTTGLDELCNYWKRILLKTGPVSYALCQQALALNACPFGDSNLCSSCTMVTDWRNVNQLITATPECRTAYNTFCLSNTQHPGCECYGQSGASNQECVAWQNLIAGKSSCTQTELDAYLKKNQGAGNNKKETLLYPSMYSINNFLTNEDYAILTASNTMPPQKTFFEWLFNL